MAQTFTTPKDCRKCKGSGEFVRASGMPDACAPCGGRGVVEGDRATIAARKARQAEHLRLYGLIKALAETVRPFQGRPSVSLASDGLYLLEDKEPARYAKAVASIEAGRLDVVKALGEYFLANR